MASERSSSVTFPPLPPPSNQNMSAPPTQNRQPPLSRSATFAEGKSPMYRRRSSLFSDNISETRKSLLSSTDDLLVPRVSNSNFEERHEEPSHWHSVPLGLALLPAVGGLFFKDGSHVITDITLLALAAIFLNWSVRVPWDWYFSAQARIAGMSSNLSSFESIAEEAGKADAPEEAISSSHETTPPLKSVDSRRQESQPSPEFLAAQRELLVHELLALFACFVGPIVGAWLLHAIRSQLSRPSEGLVSNYNLTVFLLASEIRPMSHLVKMIQARTLHLQRVVSPGAFEEENKLDNAKILDLSKRLEELEAHIADSAELVQQQKVGASDQITAKTVAGATSEIRKSVQPELDALNRAVRRYEKRTTISALQTESRLQDLESRLKDVVVLAAAAQRSIENQPRNFIIILLNWLCGVVVVPLQSLWYLATLPSRGLTLTLIQLRTMLRLGGTRNAKELRNSRQGRAARSRERRIKATP